MENKNYTSLEVSKLLAEAGLFQDEPEAIWLQDVDGVYGGKYKTLDSFSLRSTGEYWTERKTYIAAPLWWLMEELPELFSVTRSRGEWIIHDNEDMPFCWDKKLTDCLALAHLKLNEVEK